MAIDLLAIQPNVISRDLRSKFILLAGPPKIGKTEFCTQSPNALILATEIGTNARPGAMVQPIEKYSDFKLILRQLEKPEVKEKYDVICIDTIGILYDLCEQFICAQAGVQKIGDIGYGGGYTALSKEFEQSLRKITMMSYGLIMTCHLKESFDEEGKLLSARPDLNNRCLKIINGLVDVIGVITQTWSEKGESERWIQTRSTPTVIAGTRYKYMQPKIPFSYKNFCDALSEAIEKEGEEGATIVDKQEIIENKSRSYEEIRVEAIALWQQLVEKDPENAKIILKKVEIIFGRPMKLSEITYGQEDLYELTVLEMRDMVS